jgi:ubiquinone/menaquinone biosynthesis C-methylase UbiE
MQEQIKEIYDKTAKEYDHLVTPCRMCQFLTLIYELNLRGNEKILEIGSGPGALSIQLAKLVKNGEVVGVDISESMIELANAKAEAISLRNIEFVCGDALNLNFPDRSFDIVVTSYLLHWIPDIRRFLHEIYRVLRHGGKLGIIAPSPNMYGELRRAYRRIMKKYKRYYEGTVIQEMIGLRVYSEREIQKLLCLTGFEIIKSFTMRFKEPLTPEVYLKRVNAITDEKYLDPIPTKLRSVVREELMNELSEMSKNGLITTECSIFIIGIKRKEKHEKLRLCNKSNPCRTGA